MRNQLELHREGPEIEATLKTKAERRPAKRGPVNWRVVAVGLTLVSTIRVAVLPAQSAETQRPIQGPSGKLQRAVAYLLQHYVDSLDAEQLYDWALEGLLTRLGDPYTAYLNPAALEQLSANLSSRHVGIGVELSSSPGGVVVREVFEGTPAAEAGVQAGDTVVAVDRQPVGNATEVAQLIRGEPGSTVDLLVSRNGSGRHRHTLIRSPVRVPPVAKPREVARGVGYVRVRSMTDWAAAGVEQALKQLRSIGYHAVILDLRDNHGGFPEESVRMAGLFLDSGLVVMEERTRRAAPTVYRVQQHPRWPTLPIVLLVNRATGSAAEVFAAALRENHRAILVGDTTFGKGVRYTVLPLSSNEALIVTSARWYTPSGQGIDRFGRHRTRPTMEASDATESGVERLDPALAPPFGLTPDVVVRTERPGDGWEAPDGTKDPQLDRAVELLLSIRTVDDLHAFLRGHH